MLPLLLIGTTDQALTMKRTVTILALAPLLLTGCIGSFRTIEKNLWTYKGQPLDTAIAKLGVPSSERTIAGHKVYVWSTNHNTVLPTYHQSQTYGQVGGQSFSASTGTTGVTQAQAWCEVTMEVDAANVVTHVGYEGNYLGCSRYES